MRPSRLPPDAFATAYLRHNGHGRAVAAETGLSRAAISQRAKALGLPGAITLRHAAAPETARDLIRAAFERAWGEPL